jgi:hypothetical protein
MSTYLNRFCTDVETLEEAEFLAELDYQLHLGCEFKVDYLSFYLGDDQHEVNGPQTVRLEKTDRDSRARRIDEYLDPYWDVDGPDLVRGGWTHGPSYRILAEVKESYRVGRNGGFSA